MGRRSEATRATYACGLDAFERCFKPHSVDLLVAKIKSGELDAYGTLDKFVGWLTADGAVRPRKQSGFQTYSQVERTVELHSYIDLG